VLVVLTGEEDVTVTGPVARVVGVEDVFDGDGTLVVLGDEVFVEVALVGVTVVVVVADGVPPVGVVVGVGQAPLTAYTSTRPPCSCFGAPDRSSMCDDA
jgi:hypothetical protein